jgi:hypothetical protein
MPQDLPARGSNKIELLKLSNHNSLFSWRNVFQRRRQRNFREERRIQSTTEADFVLLSASVDLKRADAACCGETVVAHCTSFPSLKSRQFVFSQNTAHGH